MKRVYLDVKEDPQDVRGLGFVIRGVKMPEEHLYVAREGFLIAHDIFEHQNGFKAIGGVEDELEACGGIWYVRGQTGRMHKEYRAHPPEEDVAMDIFMMYRNLANGEIHDWPKPRPSKTHEWDSSFEEILGRAESDLRKEFNPEVMEDCMEMWPKFREAALPLMRIGYDKAAKRFISPDHAVEQFWMVAREVDTVFPSIDYEGQIFTLRYDNCNAFITQRRNRP